MIGSKMNLLYFFIFPSFVLSFIKKVSVLDA
uniref:Uncharacterized protein n=1 Tax=Rhizophora mucronata TaxID=61149 RepID=A0A2P2QDA3_RHIMU